MGGEPSRSRRKNPDVESAERHVGGDVAEGNSVARALVFVWSVVWGLVLMNWLWPYVRRLATRPLAALSRGCRLVWPRHTSHAVGDRDPLASRGQEDPLPDRDSASTTKAAHPLGGRQSDELRDVNRVVNRTTVMDDSTPGSFKSSPSGSEDAAPPPHPDDDDVPSPLPTASVLAPEQTVTWSPTLGVHSEVPTPPPPKAHSEASIPLPPAAGHPYAQVASEAWVCALPGCSRPCYVEVSGRIHDYCGRTHAMQHKNMLEGHHHLSSFVPAPVVDTGSGPILFYNRDEPYYEFTNFYRAKIKLDGKVWPTTEHYFQAQKFIGTPYVEQIRKLEAPRMAFNLSRNPQVARWRREDWEQEKVNIMYKALLAKFSQHERLRSLLLGTGQRELIEHSPYDRFWGDGGDGTGENMLGRLLMKVRADLLGVTMDIPLPSYLLPQQMSGPAGGPGHGFSSLPKLETPAPETESPTKPPGTTAAGDTALITNGASGSRMDAELGVPGPVEGQNTGNTATVMTHVEELTHVSIANQAVDEQEKKQESPDRLLEDLSTKAAESDGILPTDSTTAGADLVANKLESDSTTDPHSATPMEVPVPSTVPIPATDSQSQHQVHKHEEAEGEETCKTEMVEKGEWKEEEEEVEEEAERKLKEEKEGEEEGEGEQEEEDEEEEGDEREEESHEQAVTGKGEQDAAEGEGEEAVEKEKTGEMKEGEEQLEVKKEEDYEERKEGDDEANDQEKEGENSEETEDRNAEESSQS